MSAHAHSHTSSLFATFGCRSFATAWEAYATLRSGKASHLPHKDIVVPPMYTQGKEKSRQKRTGTQRRKHVCKLAEAVLHARVRLFKVVHKLARAYGEPRLLAHASACTSSRSFEQRS
eukprot:6212816-Pleurochrysis_carterae.AAC.1